MLTESLHFENEIIFILPESSLNELMDCNRFSLIQVACYMFELDTTSLKIIVVGVKTASVNDNRYRFD